MSDQPETRSLHRKLAQVMYEAERIPKNGAAPREMGGYPFVQVGDAADFIRKALAEKVISMIPSAIRVVGQVDRPTKSGGSMTTVDLIVTWTLTDGESGETATIESFGAGADGGDKYSGKATTSAMKYALLAGFLLSTGEDSELGGTPAPAAAPPRIEQHDGSLIGTATKQTARTTDFLVRQSPDGPFLGFRLKDGAGAGVICEVRGPMAAALALNEAEAIGQRVQVWGAFHQYTKADMEHPYRAFRVAKLQTPAFTLPATQEAPAAPSIVTEDAAGSGPVAPSDEAVPVPEAAGTSSPEPTAQPSAPQTPATAPPYGACGNASPFGDGGACGLPVGHSGKLHRQLDAERAVVGSWPTT